MKTIFKWLKKTVLTLIILVLLIIIPVGVNKLYEAIRASSLSEQEQQLEDIERLSYLMHNEFPDYKIFDEEHRFTNAIKTLKQKVSTKALQQDAFNLEVIKIIAALQDPHTGVSNFRTLFPNRFPYNAQWVNGHFYLTSGQFDAKWLGAEITHFGSTNANEVYSILKDYCFSPNDSGTAYFMNIFEASPYILHHEGVIDDSNKITLEVKLKSGERTTLSFNATTYELVNTIENWASLSQKHKDDKPLWKTNNEKNYWYKHLEKDNILYLRYALSVDQGDIEQFWNELFDKIDKLKPNKMVLDLRDNPGGDSQNQVNFLHRLMQDAIVNKKGKLFTFTNGGTGSAAISLASEMERLTNTFIVGEKTMDKASTTSDPTYFTLPHSDVTLIVPSLYAFHAFIGDQRNAINPDFEIIEEDITKSYTEDALLDFVKTYKTPEELLQKDYAQLPKYFEGGYSFSPIRNLTLTQKDSVWHVSIDDLTQSVLLQQDSTWVSQNYKMQLIPQDSLGQVLTLKIHDSELTLERLPKGTKSLIDNIKSENFDAVKQQLQTLSVDGKLPYYLDRPFFQTHTYVLYNERGFDSAHQLNEITKLYFPGDPITSIIDYELYQRENKTFGKVKSFFPIAGKLIKRYYRIVTTDKVMNDQYNAFIGS